MSRIVQLSYEVQVICQQYACKDIDRDDAHNELVRAGLLDVEAADLLDIHDAATNQRDANNDHINKTPDNAHEKILN